MSVKMLEDYFNELNQQMQQAKFELDKLRGQATDKENELDSLRNKREEIYSALQLFKNDVYLNNKMFSDAADKIINGDKK